MVAQMVKNLPAVQETWVQSVGREDPLEKGMATHSGILAWRIPGTGEPGGLQSTGHKRVGHDWVTFPFTFALQYCVGFCHISTRISYRSMYVPPAPNFHPILPLPVVRDHWIWAPCAIQKTFIGYLILHMVMYMFQCCSLNSSHPFLPLLCPEVCSLCLHLYCCPPHRLISTIFLDSICMC